MGWFSRVKNKLKSIAHKIGHVFHKSVHAVGSVVHKAAHTVGTVVHKVESKASSIVSSITPSTIPGSDFQKITFNLKQNLPTKGIRLDRLGVIYIKLKNDPAYIDSILIHQPAERNI